MYISPKIKLQWEIYYLPMYISSWRNMQAKAVTMTVDKGLNMAEKSGPLLEMHQAWVKNEIADPTAWLYIYMNWWTELQEFIYIWAVVLILQRRNKIQDLDMIVVSKLQNQALERRWESQIELQLYNTSMPLMTSDLDRISSPAPVMFIYKRLNIYSFASWFFKSAENILKMFQTNL